MKKKFYFLTCRGNLIPVTPISEVHQIDKRNRRVFSFRVCRTKNAAYKEGEMITSNANWIVKKISRSARVKPVNVSETEILEAIQENRS
jgi:hypothetical protein